MDDKVGIYRIASWLMFLGYMLILIFYSLTYFLNPLFFDFVFRFEHWIYFFILISVMYWIYELGFIRILSSLSAIEDRVEKFQPKEDDRDRLEKKIAIGITTFSSILGVAFSLLIFLLGFFIISKRPIGLNFDTTIVSISSIALIISGIYSLLGLDKYDTAACLTFNVNEKWEMRKSAKNDFLNCWYFLIFGVMTALSLMHFLLTLIGYTIYVFLRNRYWEKFPGNTRR